VQRGKPRLRVSLQELLAIFLVQRHRGRAFDDGTAKLSADSWKTAVLAGVELYDLVQSVVLAMLSERYVSDILTSAMTHATSAFPSRSNAYVEQRMLGQALV
jgi:hypothetical protein